MSDASAPGKLVIAGEYSVLYGAPAIVMAVGVRARASVSIRDDGRSILSDSARGEEYPFDCEKKLGFQWLEAAPGDRGDIPQAVLETIMAEMPGVLALPALTIGLDTDAFYCRAASEPRKLGLGSSAAVLVALVGAIANVLEVPLDKDSMTRICVRAHRKFQRGHGSGLDIAAAVNGGVVGVRVSQSGTNMCVDRLTWPDGLFILPVWSGESASTVELLSNLDSFRARNPGAFDRLRICLSKHAESVSNAWRSRSVDQILPAIDGFVQALRCLDREAEIGILTKTHERLRVLAEQSGAHYKTSGAGGGDFGFAYTDSATIVDSVRKAYQDAGFSVLEMSSSTTGLMINNA